MQRVRVKLLEEGAKLPTVAHPGEDLAYDVYALDDVILPLGKPVWVRTGIAVQAERYGGVFDGKTIEKLGLIVKDRSSMAGKGITTRGGVIDAGYTGEIKIAMTNTNKDNRYEDTGHAIYGGGSQTYSREGYQIKAGDKIAQLIPIPVLTGDVVEVDKFEDTARGGDGFGSSGR
jgi:dUTP pyrophosphatase